ncbi:unnamed protein product, partial [Cyprideis torosa]
NRQPVTPGSSGSPQQGLSPRSPTLNSLTQASSPTPPSWGSQAKTQPQVDFEFDVKVLINSGKCVLHNKTPSNSQQHQDEHPKRGRHTLEPIGEGVSPASPRMGSRTLGNSGATALTSSGRLKQPQSYTGISGEATTFLIPGLDVKVHYVSKTDRGFEPVVGLPASSSSPAFLDEPVAHQSSRSRSSSSNLTSPAISAASSKRASLFTWLSLHSVPKEILVTPAILDFLEQALEPIPMAESRDVEEDEEAVTPPYIHSPVSQTDSSSSTSVYAYSSFPVDVIVYFHMQHSVFRFSCLPYSRVECLLKLPSLDLVFSSKRSESRDEECSEPTLTPLMSQQQR